jgi:predicted esterase
VDTTKDTAVQDDGNQPMDIQGGDEAVQTEDTTQPTDPGQDLTGPDTMQDIQDTTDPGQDVAVDTGPPLPEFYLYFYPDSRTWGEIPYPGDYLVDSSGHIDMSIFPNPDSKDLIDAYLAVVEDKIDGFSPGQTVYVSFNATVDVSGFDTDFLDTNDSHVFMADITKGPHYGEQVPLVWKYQDEMIKFWPAHTLAVQPVGGWVLYEGDTYAFCVIKGLTTTGGDEFEPTPGFQACINGDTSCPAPVARAFEPLRKYLTDKNISTDSLIGCTAFTISHPRADLIKIREYINSHDAPDVEDMTKKSWTNEYDLYEGHYTAPNFLHGDPPYKTDGGNFEFDEQGNPKVGYMEEMRFALTVPKNRGSGPLPVAVVMHGTGGDYESFLRSSPYNPAKELSKAGIACIGIDEPLHGARSDPPLSADDTDLYSFNIFNPDAGRTVQRQSIADEITLLRMIKAGKFNTTAFSFDPGKVLFWGHSQGGISGAMLFGVEDGFKGGVLSGAGAGLINALLDRKINVGGMPLDAKQAVSIIFNIPQIDIDRFHPLLTMAQQVVDVSDPNSYTPFYFETWSQGGEPRQIFMTQGMLDIDSPPSVAEAMIAGAGLAVVDPACEVSLGMDLRDIQVLKPPVTKNIQGQYTAVVMQFCKYGHFAAFNSKTAACTYREFMRELGLGNTPSVDPCDK